MKQQRRMAKKTAQSLRQLIGNNPTISVWGSEFDGSSFKEPLLKRFLWNCFTGFVRLALTCLNLSRLVLTCINPSRLVLNLSEPVETCLNLSRVVFTSSFPLIPDRSYLSNGLLSHKKFLTNKFAEHFVTYKKGPQHICFISTNKALKRQFLDNCETWKWKLRFFVVAVQWGTRVKSYPDQCLTRMPFPTADY